MNKKSHYRVRYGWYKFDIIASNKKEAVDKAYKLYKDKAYKLYKDRFYGTSKYFKLKETKQFFEINSLITKNPKRYD